MQTNYDKTVDLEEKKPVYFSLFFLFITRNFSAYQSNISPTPILVRRQGLVRPVRPMKIKAFQREPESEPEPN